MVSPLARLALALMGALALSWALMPVPEASQGPVAALSAPVPGAPAPSAPAPSAPAPSAPGLETTPDPSSPTAAATLDPNLGQQRAESAPLSRTDVAAVPRPERADDKWIARHCRAGRVALTFDDGPSKHLTPGLLRYLRRNDLPATFFMVGDRVRTAPGVARAVARDSRLFTVGNHTWRHPDLRTLSRRDVRRTLRGTSDILRHHGIEPSNLMRPPYGALDRESRAGIRAEGLIPVLWNVDSADWKSGDPRQIAHRILSQLERGKGNIVLQHDGVNNSPNSIAAVPRVVRVARQRGYCFVPLNEKGRAARPLKPLGSR